MIAVIRKYRQVKHMVGKMVYAKFVIISVNMQAEVQHVWRKRCVQSAVKNMALTIWVYMKAWSQ